MLIFQLYINSTMHGFYGTNYNYEETHVTLTKEIKATIQIFNRFSLYKICTSYQSPCCSAIVIVNYIEIFSFYFCPNLL